MAGKSKKTIILIISIVVVLLIAASVTVFFVLKNIHDNNEHKDDITGITDEDRNNIKALIDSWLSPELLWGEDVTREEFQVPDYKLLWSLLSESSPIKQAENGGDAYSAFKIWRKDFVPLISHNIDSFSIEGNLVVAKCTCTWAALDNEMLGAYPEHSAKAEFTVIKEGGDWKIYDLWFEHIY